MNIFGCIQSCVRQSRRRSLPGRKTVAQVARIQEKEHFGPRNDKIRRILAQAEEERRRKKLGLT